MHIVGVPPLRDRRSDIPELAAHFLATTCTRFGIRRKRIDPAALESLVACEWRRNNVRELRNIIERMIIATDDDLIVADHVPADARGGGGAAHDVSLGPRPRTLKEMKVEAERQIVVSSLERNDWHISRTAEELGLSDHASLLKIMRRLNLKRS